MFADTKYGRPYPAGATARLAEAIKAVCPAEGASIGRWNDRETWRLDALPEATDEQRAAALEVMNTFEPWEDFAVSGDVDPPEEQPQPPPEAPPSEDGASSYPGVMLSVDQKRAQLSDAVQVEYRARLEPIAPRKGDLTAERVYLTNLPERDDAQMLRINDIDAEYRALMDRERDLSNWLATMLAALIAKPAADLDTYDPSYGWP